MKENELEKVCKAQERIGNIKYCRIDNGKCTGHMFGYCQKGKAYEDIIRKSMYAKDYKRKDL